jgi:hypothetical protein
MAVAGGKAIDGVLTLFMALLSFVESAPRAYRLKAGNAASPISTFAGAIPTSDFRGQVFFVSPAISLCRSLDADF